MYRGLIVLLEQLFHSAIEIERPEKVRAVRDRAGRITVVPQVSDECEHCGAVACELLDIFMRRRLNELPHRECSEYAS